MREYVYIKRKTVKRIAALTVFLIVMAAAAAMLWRCLKPQPVAMVETLSRNVIACGGKEVACFRGLADDSTLLGLTLDKDTVRYAPRLHLTHEELKAVLGKTIAKLKDRAEYIAEARKETGYYTSVHSVQDEGYGMVASYDTQLSEEQETTRLLIDTITAAANASDLTAKHITVRTSVEALASSDIAVASMGGWWRHGRWAKAFPVLSATKGKELHSEPYVNGGRVFCFTPSAVADGEEASPLVRRTDSLGIYIGMVDSIWQADGHGSYLSHDGTFYEGHWAADKRDGYGFSVSTTRLRAGEWKDDSYRGERMKYTSERIYGIDISKYQHGKGRRRYSIQWGRLRISHLGKVGSRNAQGTVNYPVSFVYIKSTEGATVRNAYFKADYRQSRSHGFRTGAYHFFSISSSATAQANYFLRNTTFKRGDMPPVLDLEPTDAQIRKMGGAAALFRAVRTWLNAVRRRTGVRPVLYVGQRFVNKYLTLAPDIKRDYNVWIARYGEYKPDVKLVYWQLCPDGRVTGIKGEVDINVFNGYSDSFDKFVSTETVR